MNTDNVFRGLVVVIPTRNREALLRRALKSVQEQSYQDYRVIIVNDGSTDTTREYLDSLTHSRIHVIHREKAGGVNAARNAAFKTLKKGEWAVPLDDDDMLLPNALATIAETAAKAPPHIQIFCFSAITRTPKGEFVTGGNFREKEAWFEPTYRELMTDTVRAQRDMRMVLRWTLFPGYLFSEEVNGFEGEWWLRVGRDGIGIRYVPERTTLIDQTHGGEQLSTSAARRNPASFVRAHIRIFQMHHEFLAHNPRVAMARAIEAMKLSIRAVDSVSLARFAWYYVQALCRLLKDKISPSSC